MAKCNFCGAKASFDGKTIMGPWANMCNYCLGENGFPGNPDLAKVIREPRKAVGHELSYEAWIKRVDEVLIDLCGMTHSDLPDYNIRDAYDDGVDPELVANDVLMEADFY